MTLNKHLLIFATLVLTSCSTGSQIVTGVQRNPTNPATVKIYQQIPVGAEEIGLVTSQADGKKQAATDKALNRLKERVAKLGANGIVLGSVDIQKGFVLYGPWIIPQDNTTIQAKAIWVP